VAASAGSVPRKEGTMTTATRDTRTTATPVVTAGVAATVIASLATGTIAAVGHAAGVSLDMGGEPIPMSGFAMLTAVFSLIGVALAAVLARRARHAQRTFVRTTVVLTALSLVPDAIADAAAQTKILLMLTHLVAAAIVVPALARRLPA